MGLQWGDINFEAGKLRVERAVEKTKLKGLRIKLPKTKHGRRTVSIPAGALAVLRGHRKAQQEPAPGARLRQAAGFRLCVWHGRGTRARPRSDHAGLEALRRCPWPAEGHVARSPAQPCVGADRIRHGPRDCVPAAGPRQPGRYNGGLCPPVRSRR